MIDAINSRSDLMQAITELNKEALFVPSNFGSSQDRHEPTRVIADVEAGGLGLPDRDYYFKADAVERDTRKVSAS